MKDYIKEILYDELKDKIEFTKEMLGLQDYYNNPSDFRFNPEFFKSLEKRTAEVVSEYEEALHELNNLLNKRQK